MLKITVITICYNNLPELMETMASVDGQDQKPFEHLVIDGSTGPAIRDHLEQNPQPAYRKWISEPDRGISDAFNKGIRHANGEIISMLNSGDTFFSSEVIGEVQNSFSNNPDITWLHGKYKICRGEIWVIIGKPFDRQKLYRGMRSICHQSMFLKKSLHDKYGFYDVDEKIGMDYDLLCRIKDEPFLFLDIPLIVFAPAGTSSVNYLQSLKDTRAIYMKYFGNSLKLRLWQFRLQLLHYILVSPVGKVLYKLKTRLKLENM